MVIRCISNGTGHGQTELFLPHRCEFFIERLALAAGLRTLAMVISTYISNNRGHINHMAGWCCCCLLL